MRIHDLKCWPPFFRAIADGDKRGDVRINDRDYRPGDFVLLREYLPPDDQIDSRFSEDRRRQIAAEIQELEALDRDAYTGDVQILRVTYVLEGVPGLAPGYVVLSWERCELVPVDVEVDVAGGLTR